MADPTREQLRQLHGAFGEFWDASPWQALDDLDVVAVEHPSGRYTGYCSVLGSAFREYGLAVFIGDEGLSGYLDMVNDEVDPESPEGFERMNALLAVRGDRESLSESEIAAMRRARLRYRGRGVWPIFRSLRPGYLPWRLDEDEAVFLTAALGNMIDVVSRVSSGDLVLYGGDDPDLMLMRVFRDGAWIDRWMKYPEPVTPAPAPEYSRPRAPPPRQPVHAQGDGGLGDWCLLCAHVRSGGERKSSLFSDDGARGRPCQVADSGSEVAWSAAVV